MKYAGNLEGYSVLVTGGGTGIGTGCAIEMAADGAMVTISGRRAEVLEAAAEKIAAAANFGGGVQIVTGDVTVEADVEAMVAKALEPSGKKKAQAQALADQKRVEETLAFHRERLGLNKS